MILVIDNFDSFTYNLVQYLGELGCDLQVVRNNAVTISEIQQSRAEAIVISPGPGRPENAGISVPVFAELGGKIPILGVCLGHQALAYAFGGQIISAPKLMHGKTSEVNHTGDRLFQNINDPFIANRYHSLIVDRNTVPSELEIIAETPEKVVMGLKHRSLPLYGVQFHPESILTPDGKTLLKNYLDLSNEVKS